MGLLPLEVENRKHRGLAWVVYILLLLSAAVYIFVAVEKAISAEPVVSVGYIFEDLQLPDIYLCPEVFSKKYKDLKISNVKVVCYQYTKHEGFQLRAGKQGFVAINTASELVSFMTNDTSFTYVIRNSSCLVEPVHENLTSALDGTSSYESLCFRYKTSAYNLTKEAIKEGATPFAIGLLWDWGVDIEKYAKDFHANSGGIPLPARTLSYDFVNEGQNFDMSTVRGTSLGGFVDIQLFTNIFESLNETKKTIRTAQASHAEWLPDLFPQKDGVGLTFSFDFRGTFLRTEKSAFDVTILISQIISAWSVVGLIFGFLFSMEVIRHSNIHKAKRYVETFKKGAPSGV